MKTLGMLTNGGDTPSLNSVLAAIKKAARMEGFDKIWGIEGGYLGLIEGRMKDITEREIEPAQGGSILYSLRDSPLPLEIPVDPKEKQLWEAKLQGAIKTIKDKHIDVLVAIGGDGTIAATKASVPYIHEETNCKVYAFPRTIDNDIRTFTSQNFENETIETAVAPGAPTAMLRIVDLTHRLKTTAETNKRVFTLETMGRDAGWLALAACYGGAEFVIVPEFDVSSDVENQLYDLVAEMYRESQSCVVAVSDGTKFDGVQLKKTAYGKRKLGGVGDLISLGGPVDDKRTIDGIQDALKKRNVVQISYPNGRQNQEEYRIVRAVDERCQHGDYYPRMGGPSQYDMRLSEVLGDRLRKMLHDGKAEHMPVLARVVPFEELTVDVTSDVPFSKVEQMLLPVKSYFNPDRLTANLAFADFMNQIISEQDKKLVFGKAY